MFSLRTHLIICASLFAALILMAIGGNALLAAGVIAQPSRPNLAVLAVFFGLFLAFGFSFVPVMVMAVMRAQTRLGNERVDAVRRLVGAQKLIIWLIWGVMLAGTIIAVPAAIMNGALDPPTLEASQPPLPK